MRRRDRRHPYPRRLARRPARRRHAPRPRLRTQPHAPVASLSAGLAQVQTLQGVFVFGGQVEGDDRPWSTASPSRRRRTATATSTSATNPTTPALQEQWRAALKEDPHASIADLEDAVNRRRRSRDCVLVVSRRRDRSEQTKSWVVNPLTRQVIGVRYRYYAGYFSSYPLAASAPRSVQYVWALSNVLDTELASQGQRAAITAVQLGGEPAHKRDRLLRRRKPTFQALHRPVRLGRAGDIAARRTPDPAVPARPVPPRGPEGEPADRPEPLRHEAGLPLRPAGVRPAQGRRHTRQVRHRPRSGAAGSARRSQPLHLVVDAPALLAAGQGTGSPWRSERPTDERLWLTYRLGMDELTVSTAGTRRAVGSPTYDVGHGFIVQTWSSQPEARRVRMGGARRHRQRHAWRRHEGLAHRFGGSLWSPIAPSWRPSPSASTGPQPVSTLRRVAESVRPAKPGPHLPGSAYDRWPWLIAIAAAAALVLAWRRATARSRDPARCPLAVTRSTPAHAPRPPVADRHGGGRGRRAAVVASAVRRRRPLRGERVAGAARRP